MDGAKILLLALPEELIIEIWAFFDASDIARLSLTSKAFNKISWDFVRAILIKTATREKQWCYSKNWAKIKHVEITAHHPCIDLLPLSSLDSFQIDPPVRLNKLTECKELSSLVLTLDHMLPEEELRCLACLTTLKDLTLAFGSTLASPERDLAPFISGLTVLESLFLYSVESASGLGHLTRLRVLGLEKMAGEDNPMALDDVGRLTNLTDLILSSAHINGQSFDKISTLSNLNTLNLRLIQMPTECLTTLLCLSSLRHLDLCGRHVDSDPHPVVAQLTGLTELIIEAAKGIDFLDDLTNLKSLNLDVMYSDRQVDLSRLMNLEYLTVQTLDLMTLTALTNLKELVIETMQASDLDVLKQVPSLVSLTLPAVHSPQFTALLTLTNLTKFSCTGRASAGLIHALKGLSSLQRLEFVSTEAEWTALTHEFSHLVVLNRAHDFMTFFGDSDGDGPDTGEEDYDEVFF